MELLNIPNLSNYFVQIDQESRIVGSFLLSSAFLKGDDKISIISTSRTKYTLVNVFFKGKANVFFNVIIYCFLFCPL